MKLSHIFQAVIFISLLLSCEKEPDEKIISEQTENPIQPTLKEYIKSTYIEPEHILYLEEKYSINGIKTSETYYNTENTDSLVIKKSYEYEYSQNNIIACKRTLNQDGILLYQSFYNNTFNNEGELIFNSPDVAVPWQTIFYFYNEKNQMVKKTRKPQTGDITNYLFYYDDANNMTRRDLMDEGDTILFERTLLNYNSLDQLINIYNVWTDYPDQYIELNYSYDNEGNITEKHRTRSYNGEPNTESEYYYYDTLGRITKTVVLGEDSYLKHKYSSDDFTPVISVSGEQYDNYIFNIPF